MLHLPFLQVCNPAPASRDIRSVNGCFAVSSPCYPCCRLRHDRVAGISAFIAHTGDLPVPLECSFATPTPRLGIRVVFDYSRSNQALDQSVLVDIDRYMALVIGSGVILYSYGSRLSRLIGIEVYPLDYCLCPRSRTTYRGETVILTRPIHQIAAHHP